MLNQFTFKLLYTQNFLAFFIRRKKRTQRRWLTEQQAFSYNTATVWCKVVLMFECIWNICGEEFHKLDSGPSYSWVYSNACFGAHMDLHLSHYTATKYTKKPQMVLLVCLFADCAAGHSGHSCVQSDFRLCSRILAGGCNCACSW